jgi:triosephosphate isomerase (TIM)
MTMRKKLIVGNWKMNGSLAANASLLSAIKSASADKAQLAVCVPAVYLAQTQAVLQGAAVAWGAQDCSAYASGAYTGELSAAMLKEFDCRYVIVGHSERRQYHAESDELVAAKAKAAIANGLTPIVCVGESLAEREAEQTQAVVSRQLAAVLQALGADAVKIVVAYEPVWAIGTGKVATPEQAQAVHAAIREQLRGALSGAAENMQLLYGGSMKPDNAAQLLQQPDIDGGLIGGAALKAADFLAIFEA